MDGSKPNWKSRKDRKQSIIFAKGYFQGVQDERDRIISDLLRDGVVITNLEVKLLERVVEIVEG
jgi:hypothetical protein